MHGECLLTAYLLTTHSYRHTPGHDKICCDADPDYHYADGGSAGYMQIECLRSQLGNPCSPRI